MSEEEAPYNAAGSTEAEQAEVRIDLERAALLLTERQREAFALWVAGNTYEEIGAAMDISRSGSRQLIRRGCARIREFLC